MRHALSHLKRRRMRCILCRQRFKQLPFARDHILQHIDDMAQRANAGLEKGRGVANGKARDDSDGQEGIQSQTPEPTATDVDASRDQSKQKPVKTKKPALDRNSRIIRNLRSLIKKLAVLHKGKDSEATAAAGANFTDEQVVILDSEVVVRGLTGADEEGRGGGAENGGGCSEAVYFVCPSESCDKVFLKSSGPVLKHIVRFHLAEEKALEKLFVWSNRKCSLCIG